LIILCNEEFYKKEIPLYTSIVFSACIIIYGIATNNVGDILNNIFSNGILFSFIFIATDPLTSSYTVKGKIIYSIITGLVTFGLFLIYPPLSALGGILFASICHDTLDKLTER
jgi:Na+-translocating ferredoxin:NAD+ oxidoreductase RnfD subunit